MFNFDETLQQAKACKKVYIGPFIGEFGHMLIHVLPFINYLYEQGIQITFCGLNYFESLCRDENGNKIVHDYINLQSYLQTGTPDGNTLDKVTDRNTYIKCLEFVDEARSSMLPFFDMSDPGIYKFWFLWHLKNGYGKLFNLGKAYNPNNIKENAIGFYTRTKVHTGVTGPEWNVPEVVNIISKYCDIIYVAGHPEQSHTIDHPKVCNVLSVNNTWSIKFLSRCKIIVSYNSGTAYMPRILGIPAIIIHKGTLQGFKHTLECSNPLSNSVIVRATNIEELDKHLKELNE
jgi:hypothetical protein